MANLLKGIRAWQPGWKEGVDSGNQGVSGGEQHSLFVLQESHFQNQSVRMRADDISSYRVRLGSGLSSRLSLHSTPKIGQFSC